MNERQTRCMPTIFWEGSISRATGMLYVSQPSASQMVRKVEEELHTDLLVRHMSPLVLTPTDECYVRAARAIRGVQQNLDRQLEEIRLRARGSIRFGMSLQRSLKLLSDILPRFHARYPIVDLGLTESGSDTLKTMLLNHQPGIAYLVTSTKINPLNYILVNHEELALLAFKSMVLARRVKDGTSISIREAEEEAFTSLKSGYSTRIIQDRLFAGVYIPLEVLFETESVEVAKHAVGPCRAVFLCPRNYIDISSEVGKTCMVYPAIGVEQGQCFYICHQKNQYLTHYTVELTRLSELDFELSRSEEFPKS